MGEEVVVCLRMWQKLCESAFCFSILKMKTKIKTNNDDGHFKVLSTGYSNTA